MCAWCLNSWWDTVYFLFHIQMHQHDRWYRAPAAFCCRPSLLLWVKYGRYMIFIEMWTVDSPSDCTLWGWKMDLLRNTPFMLLFHLSSLPCSMTPWGTHSPTQIFFSVAALQRQRGGPGRVNSVSSSISCSSDFQLEIPGVSWGQCYRQQPLSWSALPPHRLPQACWGTPGHLIWCPADGGTVLTEDSQSLPMPQTMSGFQPSHSNQKEQLDPEACAISAEETQAFHFLHTFSACFF